MGLELDLVLDSELSSPGSARSSLEALAGAIDSAVLQDLRLMVSELVTNSIKHAVSEGAVRIEVRARPRSVHVAVIDTGPGFEPSATKPQPLQEGGRGLYIVDRLAHRWGVDTSGDTRVWFEVVAERS